MHRVDHSTAKAVRQAIEPAGTPGYFGDGNAGTGDPPTVLSADFMNALQEELVSAVLGSGVALDKTKSDQLARAIAILAGLQGAATGVNALVFNPAGHRLPSYLTGHRLFVTIPANNSGAVTLDAFGLGAKSVRAFDASALRAGDLVAGTVAIFLYDGTQYRHLNGQRGLTATPGTNNDTLATTAFATAADAVVLAAALAQTVGSNLFVWQQQGF